MLIAPLLALKLVLLKLAIPFTVVLALSIVIAVPVVNALLSVTAPEAATEPLVVPVMLWTAVPPPPPPPPLVKQVEHEIWPVVASRLIGPLAATATVPLWFGKLMAIAPAGAAVWPIVNALLLVAFLNTNEPAAVEPTPKVRVEEPLTPTVKLPPTVMRPAPLSLMMEFSMLVPEVNFDKKPAVPPVLLVTLPVGALQFPTVVQT